MKGKVSDCILIDHCVDLSHNCNVYFDKGAGIFSLESRARYEEFLELKRFCEPHTLIKTKLGSGFNRLLWRANNLSIIKEHPANGGVDLTTSIAYDGAEEQLFAYQPIQWGGKRLDISESNILVQHGFHGERRRNSDDDYDYECRVSDESNDQTVVSKRETLLKVVMSKNACEQKRCA